MVADRHGPEMLARAAERCPTCDRRLASLADYAAWRAWVDDDQAGMCPLDRCWAPMHSACIGERVDWRARALTAEAHADDTHRQCYDCRKDRRLEPTRIAVAVAAERRNVLGEVVAWLRGASQEAGHDGDYAAASTLTGAGAYIEGLLRHEDSNE